MIPPKPIHITEESVFQKLLRDFLFYLLIGRPFDPKQLLVLFSLIFVGIYLAKTGSGLAKIAGKVLAIFGITILAIRVFVVLYLATQI